MAGENEQEKPEQEEEAEQKPDPASERLAATAGKFDKLRSALTDGNEDEEDFEDDEEETEDESEEDDEPAPAPAKKASAPAPEVVAAAKKKGFTDEEIKSLSDSGLLAKVVGAKAEEQDTDDEPAEDEDAGGQQDEDDKEYLKEVLALSEDQYPEELVGALKALRGELAAIKPVLKRTQEREHREQQEEYIREADELFGSLHETHAGVFGEGSFRQVRENREFFDNRVKVLDMFEIIAAGVRASGKTPDAKTIFHQAVGACGFNETAKDKASQREREKVRGAVRDRTSGQFTQPPRKADKEKPSMARAARRFDDFLSKYDAETDSLRK